MNKLSHHKAYQFTPDARLSGNSRPIPKWQRERARRLHHKFLSVEKSLSRGASVRAAFKMFCWYWKDRNYRCDSSRKARFGQHNLVQLFYKWRRGGRTQEAIRLNYGGLAPSVPAALLMRFVEFCSRHQFRHMKPAWAEFTRRKGWIGRGRQGSKPVKVTYGQLQYYFSGEKFAHLQAAHRKIGRAEAHQAALRLEYMGEIQARLPQNSRRRRTGQDLSFEGASL